MLVSDYIKHTNLTDLLHMANHVRVMVFRISSDKDGVTVADVDLSHAHSMEFTRTVVDENVTRPLLMEYGNCELVEASIGTDIPRDDFSYSIVIELA